VSSMAMKLHDLLAASDDFEPLHRPELNILCFRRRGASSEETAALRERLIRSGRAWITSTVLRGERVLRVTIMNPRTGPEHLDALLAALREV
jgi:L-2,4-diaminobutyrate decarboxylase